MIEIEIPGFGTLGLDHLVMDFNGTLARDGVLIEGVAQRLMRLHDSLKLHVITADTFGDVGSQLTALPCSLHVLPQQNQEEAKRAYVVSLGPKHVASIGNGRNDRLMLRESLLGIAVVLKEGAYSGTLTSADIICTSILDALDLFMHPLRLTATLRS